MVAGTSSRSPPRPLEEEVVPYYFLHAFDMMVVYHTIQWNPVHFNCRYCITSLLDPVTLPFSPAAGQFNLPVSGQWVR
jgi:hypothetical protein